MSSTPHICGLMLAYFKAGMTLSCLRTLAGQGIEKIILVDNSNCPEEYQYTLQLTQHFPPGWLEVVIAEDNLGFAKGMNLALDHARQLGEWDYFLILNNDIEAKPTLVQSLHEHMAQHPRTALLGVAADTGSTVQSGLHYQRWTGLIFPSPVAGSFHVAAGYCLLLRPTAIHGDLFNTRYFMYGEDVELSWRLRQQGWEVEILPQALLTHTPSQSSREGSLFYEYHINRGHWLAAQQLAHHAWERWVMIMLRLPLLTLRAMLRSWRFRCITPIKALVLASLALPIRPSKNN